MGKETEEKRAARLTMYEAYLASGQKVPEFCRERSLPEWKVRDWIKKARKEQDAETGFQEVLLPSVDVGLYCIVLQNGRQLNLPHNFTEQRVSQLIKLVERC